MKKYGALLNALHFLFKYFNHQVFAVTDLTNMTFLALQWSVFQMQSVASKSD